jgi:hypothetical protein
MRPEQEQQEELSASRQEILPVATDRESQTAEPVSNVMKKIETTADTQVQNLK